MSEICIELVNEAHRLDLKEEEEVFASKGGELLRRLAEETVRGGDPNGKALNDIRGAYRKIGGNAEVFDALWGNCFRAAKEEHQRAIEAEASDMREAMLEFDRAQRVAKQSEGELKPL